MRHAVHVNLHRTLESSAATRWVRGSSTSRGSDENQRRSTGPRTHGHGHGKKNAAATTSGEADMLGVPAEHADQRYHEDSLPSSRTQGSPKDDSSEAKRQARTREMSTSMG